MASSTRLTWVWVDSRSWWWTGRPGKLHFMGSQKVGHDWATWTNYRKEIQDINTAILSSLHRIAQLISSGTRIWIQAFCFQSPFSLPLCFPIHCKADVSSAFRAISPCFLLYSISGLLPFSDQKKYCMPTPSSWVNLLRRSPSYLLSSV